MQKLVVPWPLRALFMKVVQLSQMNLMTLLCGTMQLACVNGAKRKVTRIITRQ